MTKLNKFSKEEWRDVVRRVRPDWTDEQFDSAWTEFQELKRSKALH